MSVINTNITSMIAQQNLNDSKGALETNMERLSSGLRINSAKDDAAGQAIANRFEAQTTGLGQAQRNANDGISVAQTAEGALDQINDNVQRIRELTVQAQNGTNSNQDLGSIQDEINQRTEEIDRISQQTDFNGVKVLDEGVQSLGIQVGANDGESIDIDLKTINSEKLGIDEFSVARGPVGSVTSGVIDNTALTPSSSTGTTEVAGVTFDNVKNSTGVTPNSGSAGLDVVNGSAISVNMETGSLGSVFGSNGSASLSISHVVQDADGNYFATAGTDDNGDDQFYQIQSIEGVEKQSAAAELEITVLDKSEPVTAGTKDPLETLDKSLSQIDNLRSDLGAIQNRFESAINNLSTNETNLSDAQSRIEDVDYASEVAEMTKNQILQQAGTSVLAQANQLPQNALSLLG